jgi:uncharacterized protein YbjT (DUF2867 family)
VTENVRAEPGASAAIEHRPLILLTGATGYVGGRLLSRLEAAGYRVRCLTRRPEELGPRLGPNSETVYADVLERESLDEALRGGDVAFYLVHSMGSSGGFEEKDRIAAENFGQAARQAGVRRIIYLGGLGEDDGNMSPHLRSRQEVGRVLRESGVEVIEFRASIVLGAGSISFELVRALVERLPVMTTPRWVSVKAQPIGVEDLLSYLLAAVTHPEKGTRIYEIGGADQVSYAEIMKEYARQRGLLRIMIPVPVLTPRLSSLWLGLVTPVYARVGKKLIQSIEHPTIVKDSSAREAFPITPVGLREAIANAIRSEEQEIAATRWSDALSSSGDAQDWTGTRFKSRLVDSRSATVRASAEEAFRPIIRIGGKTGWYYGNRLWWIRGMVDLLVGGVGLRRGRRDPEHLRVGDAVDWWRVEAIEPNRRLRLRAEMKLPGRAWLEFEVEQQGETSTIQQTALFDPVGLSGLAYWYLVHPVHRMVFAGMLRGIAETAERESKG